MTTSQQSETSGTSAQLGVTITHIGGPTALLELGGVRLLTDPTFDGPRDYQVGPGHSLVKLGGPAIAAADLGPVDAVLLSHDQHPDNLDESGKDFLAQAPVVLSTPAAAQRDKQITGLAAWETVQVGAVQVTGVPALHGDEAMAGPVIGFILSGNGIPTVYVSGDNSSVDVVQEIVDRLGPIDVALLFAGAAKVPGLDLPLTLTAADAVRAAGVLGDAVVVPLHTEGWLHFTEGPGTVARAFADADFSARLQIPLAGAPLAL